MQAPLQVRNDSDAAQADTAKTVAQKRGLADNRPEAVAQRKLAEMMNNSPRVLQQRALSDAIHNSPRMVAQRHEMNALFGGAVKPQGDGAMPAEASLAQREEKTNNTGLPNHLKSGIESLSGMSMDHVKVHYNSDKPAQLQAHAYAQGNEIHLGAGQERHLPHEAWHVVQQAQGRVRPTVQMKGAVAVNDDAGLEQEADAMGARALALPLQLQQQGHDGLDALAPPALMPASVQQSLKLSLTMPHSASVAQRRVHAEWMPRDYAGFAPGAYGGDSGLTLAEVLEGYLAIPVGEHHEYFFELAQHADSISPGHQFHERYLALTEAPVEGVNVALNALALEINAAYDAAPLEPAVEGGALDADGANADADGWGAALDLVPAYLERKFQMYKKGDQSRFDIWQRQLKSRYAVIEGAQSRGRVDQETLNLIKLIQGLEVRADYVEEAVYDTSWKVNKMQGEIEVDTGGAVVGATLSLPAADSTQENIRKRLTVSKGRHMWDYMEAATTEEANSLIAAGADLDTVGQDIREIGLNYIDRYKRNAHKEAFTVKTSSQRVYHINKTTAEYPHCYPISGVDVVPMNTNLYNFLFSLKSAGGEILNVKEGHNRVRALLSTHNLTENQDEVLSTIAALKLKKAIQTSTRLAFAPAKPYGSAVKKGKPKATDLRTAHVSKQTAAGEVKNIK